MHVHRIFMQEIWDNGIFMIDFKHVQDSHKHAKLILPFACKITPIKTCIILM